MAAGMAVCKKFPEPVMWSKGKAKDKIAQAAIEVPKLKKSEVKKGDIEVTFGEEELHVKAFVRSSGVTYESCWDLPEKITGETHKVFDEKIEVQLKKANKEEWCFSGMRGREPNAT